jgi:signal transduction histidine kinase
MPAPAADSAAPASARSDAASDPSEPLWRAAQVFRLLSLAYAAGFQIVSNDELTRPMLGWLLFGVLSAWTLACAVAYLQGFGRRASWVVAELVVVIAPILSTALVASDHWVADNQSLPTTLWATIATISAAILRGPVAGMLAGLAVMAASATLKGYVSIDLARNATIVVELAIGLAAQTARHAHAELQRAAVLTASVAERERLARQVHDGVIQVLALVTKRGREIGCATTELADLASEQERALRRLVSAEDLQSDVHPALVDRAACCG